MRAVEPQPAGQESRASATGAIAPAGGRLRSALAGMPLARRLRILLVTTSVFALTLAGVAITLTEIRSSRADLERDLTSLGDVVAANCAAAVGFRDAEAASGALASLGARHDIARAALVLPDGQVFSWYSRPGEPVPSALPRGLTPEAREIAGRLTLVRPVEWRGERMGWLYLECTLDTLSERVRSIVLSVMALMLLAAVFAYVISLRLHRVVTEPIRRLSEAAREVSASRDYSVRVEWPTHDELGALTESFNGMMGQIEAQERALIASHELLRQAQKMEAVGQLAGGVAHDFNNLLTAINGYASLIDRRTPAEDPRKNAVREILKAGARAADLVRQLLAFGRKQQLELQVLDLRETLGDLREMLDRLIPADARLVWDLAADVPPVKADAGQIQQAVMNLVVNARDAMPKGGTITIALASEVLDEARAGEHPGLAPGRHASLSVTDQGTGIPADVQPHMFEPFFTTKDVGKGTGLGLATVYGIVKQCGGHVGFTSALDHGTTFRILLPAADERVARPAPASPAPVPGGQETILLVEDEPMVRNFTRAVLSSYGYRVLACDGPESAQVAFDGHADSIDLLVTDVMMPGMDGRALSRLLSPRRPGLRTLFMSGYADGTIDRESLETDGSGFIQKPFLPDELAARVRAALDA